MNLEDKLQDLERRWIGFLHRPLDCDEAREEKKLCAALEAALRQEVKPLTDDLAGVGIHADVWGLVNTSESYPEAIPVLVRHLSKPYHHRNKEGIVRALAVKEARGIANKTVVEQYRRLPKEDPSQPWIFHYRWAFGNTMSVIVTKDDLDDLIEIVSDTSNGESRTGFIDALAKINSPKAIEVLRRLAKEKNRIVAERAKKMLVRNAKAQEKKSRASQ
ncbi:MAG: HEAT repeat domain-containing protein [Pyrinomonadaceae bacterium]